jgi:mRNA turnover protein 4
MALDIEIVLSRRSFASNRFFGSYACPDFARSGCIATDDVLIGAGPLDQFQHTMEPQLRQLGMRTSLKKGIVTLDVDYQICKAGDKLSPEQARLLVSRLSDSVTSLLRTRV